VGGLDPTEAPWRSDPTPRCTSQHATVLPHTLPDLSWVRALVLKTMSSVHNESSLGA
jgi:hypothetical protein